MTTYRAQLHLHHLQAATGRLSVSETSSSGPWVDFDLPSSMPITDALAEWTSQANASGSLSGTYEFVWNDVGQATRLFCDTNAWVKMSLCLRDLLGFTTEVVSVPSWYVYGPNITALGIADLSGLSFRPPRHTSRANLYEYRGGRLDSYHHSRLEVADVSAIISEAHWANIADGPLLRHGLLRICCGDPSNEWGPDHLDGYADVYPIADSLEVDQVEGGPEGSEAFLTFRGSLEIPE